MTATPTLLDALLQRRILLCVGSGGVGKTTTAASLALAAARRGRRTLVLTIDPARRLANSLGLASLGHAIQQVDPALVGRGAPQPGGSLHAMMLDQKAAFDQVVERHAKDAAAVKRIMENPLYGQISGALAGAQEYAAMATLHEFDRSGEWDLIVVDTPPTAHALDFLDAPRKLSEAIDSPAIEWFRKIQQGSSRWSLIGRTGSFVLTRLAKFVGARFLDDMGVFFTEFNDILGGFKARAEETSRLLRQPKVGFVLVASPEPMAVQEALYFHQRLRASNMPFVGFIVNRVHPSYPASVTAESLARALAEQPAVAALGLSGTSVRIAADALVASHSEMELRATADQASLAPLQQADPTAIIVSVPLLARDVHDVDRLIGMERYLLG